MPEIISPEIESEKIKQELTQKRERYFELLHTGLLNEHGTDETVAEGERLQREIAELEGLLK
jgi:hypothetical protein